MSNIHSKSKDLSWRIKEIYCTVTTCMFHKVRQELTVGDKVILKGNLLVLPKSLRNSPKHRT